MVEEGHVRLQLLEAYRPWGRSADGALVRYRSSSYGTPGYV